MAGMAVERVRRALISVSDKTGLGEFAAGLAKLGVEMFSTGGTRAHLESLKIPVKDVSAYTGFPEMLDGRVKTLHPKVHAGILCRQDRPDDLAALEDNDILAIDLVAVNLYPFEATIARTGVSDEEAIEQIDIGGPSLVRAAAKNHAFVTIVTSSEQYAQVLSELQATGNTSHQTRRRLAAEAYALTARYDAAVSGWFARREEQEFPETLTVALRRLQALRYGENPHQDAALYRLLGPAETTSLVDAEQLSGKELSYNNLLDLDSALAIVQQLPGSAVAVIKHNNPCGAAQHESLAAAARAALDGDAVSAFGSVLGINRAVDAATAEVLVEPDRFIEAIVAPRFEPDAVAILTSKPKWKASVRLLQTRNWGPPGRQREVRRIAGGLLVQASDTLPDDESSWKIADGPQPTESQLRDLRFAWQLVRHVKSNAITVSLHETLVGVGAGQMSRVDSVRIALEKAGPRARGAALASDAFFPFADSIPLAAAAGIAAIIQPGGSKNDPDVIAACKAHGMPLIFTGRRHFKH